MTETWYEAKFREITLVTVERATDQSVWIAGRRQARVTDWRSYFPTWDEAHAWLLNDAERDLLSAQRALEHAQGKLGNIKGLRRPSTSISATEKSS